MVNSYQPWHPAEDAVREIQIAEQLVKDGESRAAFCAPVFSILKVQNGRQSRPKSTLGEITGQAGAVQK